MIKLVYLAAYLLCIGAQLADKDERPKPFKFEYTAQGPNGTSNHVAQGDENGRVLGSYGLNLADGRFRIVKYIADENGYRVESIETNEQGTRNENPNDVNFYSSYEEPQQPAQPVRHVTPRPRATTKPPAGKFVLVAEDYLKRLGGAGQ
ncbi:cuticle protein 16.8-like [Centruroides vittatus]|uniref:cuticle protein 16.8-like n=1 Tax=Centruroides vittatus TaxID=120091 RepID=UPI0035104FD8